MAGTDPVLSDTQQPTRRTPSNIELDSSLGDALIGAKIDGYTIERELGRGGMGVVYEAEQKEIGRKAAVKVLKPEIARDSEWSERFRNEAQILARLRDLNIVDIINFGRVPDGRPYLMMDFLPGQDLQRHLEQSQSLTVPVALNITQQMLNGLAVAHKAGIVHRDIKAENVFLLRAHNGEVVVKLVDFGLAPLKPVTFTPAADDAGNDGASLQAGTPSYVAPEQARGERSDVRSDLYSVGVTLFYMLTGRLPFEAEGVVELLRQHAFQKPPLVSSLVQNLPEGVDEFVSSLLAKDPVDRPASAEIARQRVVRLQRTLQESATAVRAMPLPVPLPTAASPEPFLEPTDRSLPAVPRESTAEALERIRPKRRWWPLGLLVLLMLLLLGGYALLRGDGETVAPPPLPVAKTLDVVVPIEPVAAPVEPEVAPEPEAPVDELAPLPGQAAVKKTVRAPKSAKPAAVAAPEASPTPPTDTPPMPPLVEAATCKVNDDWRAGRAKRLERLYVDFIDTIDKTALDTYRQKLNALPNDADCGDFNRELESWMRSQQQQKKNEGG